MSASPSLLDHPNRFVRAPSEAPVMPVAGTWSLAYDKGKETASIICPNCSAIHTIAASRISARGVVDGAVACTCKWFDYVTLDAWETRHEAVRDLSDP